MARDKKSDVRFIFGLKQCLPVKCEVKGVTYIVDSVFYPRMSGGITTKTRFEQAMLGESADLTSSVERNTMTGANDFSDCMAPSGAGKEDSCSQEKIN